MKSTIVFNKITNDSIIPKKATDGSVGYDLFSIEDKTIEKFGTEKIRTGISIVKIGAYDLFPKIESRSSLASAGIFAVGGIIDPDYHKEIIVILHNSGAEQKYIKKGNKIAQLVFYRCSYDLILDEDTNTTIDKNSRSGFGETGI